MKQEAVVAYLAPERKQLRELAKLLNPQAADGAASEERSASEIIDEQVRMFDGIDDAVFDTLGLDEDIQALTQLLAPTFERIAEAPEGLFSDVTVKNLTRFCQNFFRKEITREVETAEDATCINSLLKEYVNVKADERELLSEEHQAIIILKIKRNLMNCVFDRALEKLDIQQNVAGQFKNVGSEEPVTPEKVNTIMFTRWVIRYLLTPNRPEIATSSQLFDLFCEHLRLAEEQQNELYPWAMQFEEILDIFHARPHAHYEIQKKLVGLTVPQCIKVLKIQMQQFVERREAVAEDSTTGVLEKTAFYKRFLELLALPIFAELDDIEVLDELRHIAINTILLFAGLTLRDGGRQRSLIENIDTYLSKHGFERTNAFFVRQAGDSQTTQAQLRQSTWDLYRYIFEQSAIARQMVVHPYQDLPRDYLQARRELVLRTFDVSTHFRTQNH